MIKDIAQAINVEKTYLEFKCKGENSYNLIDAIRKCGFISLEEYFDDKHDYLFKQLKFEFANIPMSEAIDAGYKRLADKTTSVFFIDTPNETTIYHHKTKPYNEEYCIQNNIKIYNLPTGGGTIVSGKNDIVVAIVIPDNIGIDTLYILNGFAKILRKYMNDVTIIDNDILVNDEKVCGITFLRSNGMIIFLAHFSFTDNAELIEYICHIDGKPKKKPSFITAINRDILKEEVIKWLQYT